MWERAVKAEIVETTLFVSRFRFLRVGSRKSVLRIVILPGTHNKLRKGIIVGYQPEKIRWRRYEQKLNENELYATQSRETKVVSAISASQYS